MSEDRKYEHRVRRLAKSVDWRVEKSRTRNLHCNDRGGFQLVDSYSNTVLDGVDYDGSLENFEWQILEERKRLAG